MGQNKTNNTKKFSKMKTKDLNQNELSVLNAVIKGHDYAGGDFTYFDEVCEHVRELSVNQVKGYISSLQNKSYIYIDSDFEQIMLTKKCLSYFPDIEHTCSLL